MPLANRTRAGRRDCGGGAPFCAALCAALCAMRSRKRPCQPKTAKRIFGGPGSHGPSGQAKERTRILPVRRGFSAPGVPRRLPGWSFLRGLPFLRRLLCPVFRHFSAGVPLSCPRLAGSLLLLRLVWPVLPGPACRLPAVCFVCAFSSCFGCLFARSVLCARVFSLIFHLFLPDFCLSNLFSLVAQAATGLYFLPKRK